MQPHTMLPQFDGVNSWKQMVKNYNDERHKPIIRNSSDFTKPITFKEVKIREAEFNPILQKYVSNEKVITCNCTLITTFNSF